MKMAPNSFSKQKNITIITGTRIASDIKPYLPGKSCTILFDFNNTANPQTSGAAASTWSPIYLYNSEKENFAIRVGKSKYDATYQKYVMQGSFSSSWSAQFNQSYPTAGRHRYAITHEANSPSVTFRYLRGTGTPIVATITRSSFVPSENYLSFGGPADGTNSLPAGTVNLAQVWDSVLSDDEINAFFA